MKDRLDLLKERVSICLKDKTDKKSAVKSLKKAGVEFEDVSSDYGYTNFRFQEGVDGYVRAYKAKGMKEFKIQVFRTVEFAWSGIPTFEPSGRWSF